MMSHIAIVAAIALLSLPAVSGRTKPNVQPPSKLAIERLKSIEHFIIIQLENESFDQLLPDFPGAENLVDWMAGKSKDGIPYFQQVDINNNVYQSIPTPNCTTNGVTSPCGAFPPTLPNAPFLASLYWPENVTCTFDVTHRWYQEQWQHNGGKMDQFVQWASQSEQNGVIKPHGSAWSIQFWDLTQQYYGSLVQNFTTFDHFFHSYWGGSTLGCISLFAGEPPVYGDDEKGCPKNLQAQFAGGVVSPFQMTNDGVLDANCRMINDVYVPGFGPQVTFKPTKQESMGDLFDAAGVEWKWYAQDWDEAVSVAPYNSSLQFAWHHHAPMYYTKWTDLKSKENQRRLYDEKHFFDALAADTGLPQVSFVRPSPKNDMHPANNNPVLAQAHLKLYFDAIFASKYWADNKTAVLITFDENGGYADHVAPYVGDADGPATRIPAHLISPYHVNGGVNSFPYENLSVLKMFQTRFDLPRNTIAKQRVDTVRDLTNAFAEPATEKLTGLPQFVGFHGQSFKVQGVAGQMYNLLSHPTMQMNAKFSFLPADSSMKWVTMKIARFARKAALSKAQLSTEISQNYPLPDTKAWSQEGTYVSEVGLQFAPETTLHAVAGPYTQGFDRAMLNGVQMRIGEPVNVRMNIKGVSTGMASVYLQSPSVLVIQHPKLSVSIVNSDKFLNIEDAQLLSDDKSEIALFDGLLGQTADPTFAMSSSTIQRESASFNFAVDSLYDNSFSHSKFTLAAE